MGWKPEHAEARRKRFAEDPDYRASHNARSNAARQADPGYMRDYHALHKERLAEQRRARQPALNAAKRERYATDSNYRDRCKQDVKAGQTPEKRKRQRLRKYELTPEQYDQHISDQGGGCAICGRVANKCGRGRLHVDHDHATGHVRGVLCSSCNLGLGKFGDDAERLQRAVDYLVRTKR